MIRFVSKGVSKGVVNMMPLVYVLVAFAVPLLLVQQLISNY